MEAEPAADADADDIANNQADREAEVRASPLAGRPRARAHLAPLHRRPRLIAIAICERPCCS